MAKRSLRPIAALELRDVVVGTARGRVPVLVSVSPTDLVVDENYQRTLSRRSVDLIRKMVAAWDWTSYKPPTVVRDGAALHVIDGQHTAIAAATRGDLPEIPVMVVDAVELRDRAAAFVNINSDRLAVTDIQLHHAKAMAGDDDAVTIDQVCARAGARIAWTIKRAEYYDVGEIAAIAAVRTLVKRRYAAGARRVIEICVKAKMKPVTRMAILAVEALLFDLDYGAPNEGDIVTYLRAPGTFNAAERLASSLQIRQWRALATTIQGFATGGRGGRRSAA